MLPFWTQSSDDLFLSGFVIKLGIFDCVKCKSLRGQKNEADVTSTSVLSYDHAGYNATFFKSFFSNKFPSLWL